MSQQEKAPTLGQEHGGDLRTPEGTGVVACDSPAAEIVRKLVMEKGNLHTVWEVVHEGVTGVTLRCVEGAIKGRETSMAISEYKRRGFAEVQRG